MKNIYPSYYKNFRCIADKCPDTCCAGWQIVVDCESQKHYQAVEGSFGEKLKKVMTVDSDGDTVFTNINGKCPFLLENKLCEMYIELGESSLCRTCTLFPRHISFFGSRKETGLSLSCPEAARLIMCSSEPISFEECEECGEVQPNSIDPNLYFTLHKARKKAINILQNRKYSVKERLIAFLRFSEQVQLSLKHSPFVPEPDEAYFERAEFNKKRAEKAVSKYFDDLVLLEKLNPEWNLVLGDAACVSTDDFNSFKKNCPDFSWESEHLAVYFVFRYFLTAAYDGDLLTKAKFAVSSSITVLRIVASCNYTSKTERLNAMQKWSKEVEHSAENMEFLNRSIKKSRYYSTDNLINILSEE